ncbi:MAG TPA: hypothetical protein VGB37_02105 [Candidatus Lokiarchaeia archaeon]
MNDKEKEDVDKIKDNISSNVEKLNKFQKKSFVFELISFIVVIVILLLFLFNS